MLLLLCVVMLSMRVVALIHVFTSLLLVGGFTLYIHVHLILLICIENERYKAIGQLSKYVSNQITSASKPLSQAHSTL